MRLIPALADISILRKTLLGKLDRPKRVLIDFSSPNIAKPFHYGHLKSTILGNFLANLHELHGYQVTRLNFIGDWGTQYGLLSMGLDEDCEASSCLEEADGSTLAIERLLDVYVKANKRGREDQEFFQKAKERFRMMDIDRDEDRLAQWRKIRQLSLRELNLSYERLGISFDVYQYESEFTKGSRDLVAQMQSKGMIHQRESDTESDKVWVTDVVKNGKLYLVPVMKSDGTSLYITRDLMAAITRKKIYDFDKHLYVVGNDQEQHFTFVKDILNRLVDQSWPNNLIHVKMGKIRGMSSRFGNSLLLSSIIDEARDRFIESTTNTVTRKVFEADHLQDVGLQLALSSLFVYDMRNKRTRDYSFNWERAMSGGNRSGLQLQASYARLCNVHDLAKVTRGLDVYGSLEDIDYTEESFKYQSNPEVDELINCLNQLPTVLENAMDQFDAQPLLHHAFQLSSLSNIVRRSPSLNIGREPNEISARSRLTLFDCVRQHLELIIELIGLKPLRKI